MAPLVRQRRAPMLIEQLSLFAQPLGGGEGPEAFVQEFEGGSNILAVIPGGELPMST